MIVIEGCDNTGKTKLIEYLQANLEGYEFRRSPGPVDRNTMIDWLNDQYSEIENRKIVYDRFPVISESIYGPIIRGDNVLESSPGDSYPILRKFLSFHPLIVYCRPQLDKVLKMGDREQMEGVREHLLTILDRYDYYMKSLFDLGLNFPVWYDFDSKVITRVTILAIVREYGERK